MNLRKYFEIFVLTTVYFISHIPLLGFDIVNVDAPAWNYRAVQFWAYLKNFNLVETYRTYHPGVTLMWLSGFGQEVYSLIYKFKYGVRPEYFNTSDFHWILFSETLPLVLFNFILIVILYKLVEKLLSQKVVFYSVLILILEPFFIGNTRVLHLDGMLSLLGINSVLLFISYLKSKKRKELLVSGVLFGLALLTKISSLTILPSVIGIALLAGNIVPVFVFTVVGLATFLVLFPACLVDPIRVITKIIQEGVIGTGQGGQPQTFFGVETMDPGVFFYPLQFIFRASPILIILLCIALYLAITRQYKELIPCVEDAPQIAAGSFTNCKLAWKKIKSPQAIVWVGLLIYVTVYFVFMTISSKKIDRYLIPLFPPLAIFAGYALSKIEVKRKIVVPVVLVFVSTTQIIPIFPDFFAYFNPLAGGVHVASQVVGLQDWATGYIRITNYLNAKMGVENITLATYNDSSVRPTFLGITVSIDSVSDFSSVNYVIIQRDDAKLPLILKSMSLEKVFYIGSYDYYYLYKNSQL